MKTAFVSFAKLGTADQHEIVVKDFGAGASVLVTTTTQVSDSDWDSAYGASIPEKLESLLGWAGLQTEHDGEFLHLAE